MRIPSLVIGLALMACKGGDSENPDANINVSGGSAGALTVDNDGDGWTENEGDCNDANAFVFPGAGERCDGLDNDCNGTVDDNVQGIWYIDNDADNYGHPSGVFPSCNPPPGFAPNATDCDDSNASVNPGASEVCDGLDNNCAGGVDEGVTTTYYRDLDADGFGNPGSTSAACSAPSGYTLDNTDCNDASASAYPGATEICDGIDNDCDTVVDQVDDDGDSWVAMACGGGDCDDTDPTVNPGAVEVWYDGIDQDCDLNSDFDQDGDGFDSSAYGGTDCDDTNVAFNPGATEIWYDGIDQDCSGGSDFDQDGDGYTALAHGGSDCDDVAAGVYPGAIDAWYDGVDADCAGNSDFDQDGDGFDSDAYGGTDCNDLVGTINTSATEVANDGVDNNCDASPVGDGIWQHFTVANADARFTGEAAGDRAGQGDPGIDGAGDVNGDGYGDLIISALRHGSGGSQVGAAYVVLGPVSGNHSLSTADAKMTGESSGDQAGRGVAGVGDVNNDGYDDVLIGVIGDDAGGADAGASYLVYGPIVGNFDMGSADVEIRGAAASDSFCEVAWVGDVNGDAYDDFMVGAMYSSAGGPLAGAAYIFHGPMTVDISASAADAVITGETFFDEAGASNWGAGDVDGDGINDLLIASRSNDVGGTDAGAAYVVLGPITSDMSLAAADARFTGEHAGAMIGWGVSATTAGDVNNDGYADMVIGAKFDSDSATYAGAAYVIYGPPTAGSSSLSTADAKLLGEYERDFTGDSVHGPGDVDGDGFDDVLIGSGYSDAGAANAGAVYLVRGPMSGTQNLSSAAASRIGAAGAEDRLRGHGAGDVDGDGLADILVSAQLNDTAGTDAGAVYLFFGSGL